MRETISVEEAATHYGNATWELFCLEHGLDENGVVNENAELDTHFDFDYDTGYENYIKTITIPEIVEETISEGVDNNEDEDNEDNRNSSMNNNRNTRIRRRLKFKNWTSFNVKEFIDDRNENLTNLEYMNYVAYLENISAQRIRNIANRNGVEILLRRMRLFR